MLSRLLPLSILLATGTLVAAEPQADPEELARVPPTEAVEAQKQFKIKPGFRIELVASEPQLNDPVDIAFDERGRIYVVEMRGYSERRDEHLGRVSLLEDTDGDGFHETSTVFAEGLRWPTSVTCYDGGVYVLASPDLLYLKDTDNDRKADVNEVHITGFGADVNRLNVQALPNSLQWGVDNRIHGATSRNGGRLTSPVARGGRSQKEPEPLIVRGYDFAFDPRNPVPELVRGGGQYGMTFDKWGRKYVCSNSNHIEAVPFLEPSSLTNAYDRLPQRESIAVDGPAAEVHRISPDEPWRVVRTRWRVAGEVGGPIEGGGRVSGYFTAATGICIYKGDIFGPDYDGNAFVCDAGSNLVHRKVLEREPAEFLPDARRPEGEEKVEFLASPDNWFRPVQLRNGPDGALYIVDMYREIIEHPWSLPPGLKKHLDLNSGNDRGRIWRIVPERYEHKPLSPTLSKSDPKALAALLGHANGWHRLTASRLLYERGMSVLSSHSREAETLEAVSGEFEKTGDDLARLHAGALIHATNPGFFADEILKLLDEENAALVEAGLPLATDLHASRTVHVAEPELLEERLERAIGSKDARVAFRAMTLAAHAVHGATVPEPPSLLAATPDDPQNRYLAAARAQLEQVVRERTQGGEKSDEWVREELTKAFKEAEGEGKFVRLAQLARTYDISPGNGKFALSEHGRSRLAEAALEIANNPKAEPAQRIAAASSFAALATGGEVAGPVIAILKSDAPSPLKGAFLVPKLLQLEEGRAAEQFLAAAPALTPEVRDRLKRLIIEQSPMDLLAAVLDGTVDSGFLSSTDWVFLLKHPDENIRAAASFLTNDAPVAPEALAGTLERLSKLEGDAEKGRRTYMTFCSSCHKSGDSGHELGPDLATMKAMGAEKLLLNIMAPNAEVQPQFVNHMVQTKDGGVDMGIPLAETNAALTLGKPFGQTRQIPREEIVEMRSLAVSAMPDGLDQAIGDEAMADLLAYILDQ